MPSKTDKKKIESSSKAKTKRSRAKVARKPAVVETKPEEKKAKPSEAKVLKEEFDAPVEKAELPKAVPVKADTEQRREATALVNGMANIGGIRYVFEKGQTVAGGVLEAHLSMLENAGKIKRKA